MNKPNVIFTDTSQHEPVALPVNALCCLVWIISRPGSNPTWVNFFPSILFFFLFSAELKHTGHLYHYFFTSVQLFPVIFKFNLSACKFHATDRWRSYLPMTLCLPVQVLFLLFPWIFTTKSVTFILLHRSLGVGCRWGHKQMGGGAPDLFLPRRPF